jgi:thiol-disulfide isomerase/thioredoxin
MKITIKLSISALFVFHSLFLSSQPAANSSAVSGIETVIINMNDTEYKDMTFNEVIKKFRGNVIYVDFWASWCQPCKKEMPYSHELQKTFQGKKVVFLYFSTDKNPSAWKNAVSELKLTGQQYLASPEVRQQIIKEFNLQYIPRYILIDKNGKVANDNAKHPSDPDVAAEINNLL